MNSYLLFDPKLPEVSTLLEGLEQNCLPIPIDKQTLFEKINNIVSENETFELNILAHGAPGGIYVNGEFVGESQWVKGISQISSSAIQNLDISSRTINFWSCETGAGDSGSQFAEVVSITTAAAVNMSSNRVGHASQGANWDLDVNALPAVPFSGVVRDSWEHALAHGHGGTALWLKNVTPTYVSETGAESVIGVTQNYFHLWLEDHGSKGPSDKNGYSVSSSDVFEIQFQEIPGVTFYSHKKGGMSIGGDYSTTDQYAFRATTGYDFTNYNWQGNPTQLIAHDEAPHGSIAEAGAGESNSDYIIYGTLAEVSNSAYLAGANSGSYSQNSPNYGYGSNGQLNFEGKAVIFDTVDNLNSFTGSWPTDHYTVISGSLDQLKALNYSTGNAAYIDSVNIEVADPTDVSGIDTTGLPHPNFVQSPIAPEILEAVNNYNDSTVLSYSLDAELVTGSLKDLTDITVEQFLALTNDDITGGIINTASISDTAESILLIPASEAVNSGSVLHKITGITVQDATVDQIVTIDANVDFINNFHGTNIASFSYGIKSSETFTGLTVKGAELVAGASSGAPSPLSGITVSDDVDVILANNALFETGGALENVGSVSATDVQFDEIANIVSLAHVDNIAIDSGAVSSLTGGTPAYLTFDQAIAAFDAKVNTSITNFSIRDSHEELDADLSSLNTAKSSAVIDNLIVTGVSVSDFATYSGNSDVSDIAVEATIADLEGATGAVTLTTIKDGSSIAKLSELKITDLSVSDYNSHFDSIIQPASSVSYSLKDSQIILFLCQIAY